MPKISVIIPVYGVEQYIERCARSLFEQTFDDMEYIFVNDCTPDRSMDVLNSVVLAYPERAGQVKIVNLPENGGLPNARRQGLKHASGDYIAHCDSDDWMDLSAFEKMYASALANDADIVYADFYRGDGNTQVYKSRQVDVTSASSALYSITRSVMWSLCGTIIRRSLYERPEVTFPSHNNGEDFALMFQLAYNAKSLAWVNEPLYYYYYNPASMSTSRSEDSYIKRYTELKANTELVISFLNAKGDSRKFKDLIACYKMFCRTKLSPLTGNKKYRKMWLETYPELGIMDIVANKVIPFSTVLNFITVKLGVYHLINK